MMKPEDYIVVVPGAVSTEFCDELTSIFEDSSEWSDAVCGPDSAYHPEIRNCNIISITNPADQSLMTEYRRGLDQRLYEVFTDVTGQYITKYPKLSFINSDTGYQMMRYRVGEKVASHIDVGAPEHRVLSCSLLLNDGFQGGEWLFFGDHKVEVKKGDAIIFPSNFCFEHEITPVTKGVRYSMLTFLTCR